MTEALAAIGGLLLTGYILVAIGVGLTWPFWVFN